MSSPVQAASAVASPPSSSDLWNPKQYLLYDSFRARPGVDLINRLLATFNTVHPNAKDTSCIKSVVDLGCGTGKLALQLSGVFPSAAIEGVDSSNNMLDKAREAAAKSTDVTVKDRVSWKQALFEEFLSPSGGVDVIFSNAALHWSQQHATLFPHLMQQLRPGGGILAVQIPNTFREPSHMNMLKALHACGTFSKERIEEIWQKQPNTHIDGTSYYFHLLSQYASLLDLWETTYLHNLSSDTSYHPLLEWTKSTALAPILDVFPDESSRNHFLQIYSDLLEKDYPYFESKVQPGKKEILFPLRRLFIVAVRK